MVELQHGEFRIVLGGDTLVAEVAVDLKNPVEAAHDQALQVKFRGNAQIKIDVEGVVVGNKGPRHRSARQGLHHRRLNFQVALRLQKVADGAHQLAPALKDGADVFIHHQVQVPLPIPDFHIGEAVPLLRQRQDRLSKKLQTLGVDA